MTCRVSSPRLRVGTGRHQKLKLPLEQQLRQFCYKPEVDDDGHLFVSGKFHDHERLELINSIQMNLHEADNLFTAIMKSTCPYVQNALGKFLYVCFARVEIACKLYFYTF